ncbi:pilus assembly protein PilW [Vitreoscilla filiformis]|jgi:type IV pilus assembly protein PilF|uniref:Pilus assembly protein PilW n=1 Tax=Vitreoscilla filiformis TaxID=63 RepID=A0A221KHI9_VITFI|nr:type IV pilus biogenesis/stability protein PilW [Vitreoscilla filiformis]ASM78508.1 pilus assembly protein PilW [Vitreoscilla filiformis]
MRDITWDRLWQLGGVVAVVMSVVGCTSTNSDVRTASDETSMDRRANVRLELATAYFSRGQHTVALDEVKQVLVARPDDAVALNLRGLIYAAMEEHGLAEESFARAVSMSSGQNGDVLHNYGWYLCQRGRFSDAQARFEQAVMLPSYRTVARTRLAQGVCLARDGRLLEAEGTLHKAFEMDPGNPSVNLNLAEVLYRRGDYDRARFYVRRVNAVEETTNAQSLWLAIRIERRAQQFTQMRQFGRKLATQFATSPEAQLYEKGQFDDR